MVNLYLTYYNERKVSNTSIDRAHDDDEEDDDHTDQHKESSQDLYPTLRMEYDICQEEWKHVLNRRHDSEQ